MTSFNCHVTSLSGYSSVRLSDCRIIIWYLKQCQFDTNSKYLLAELCIVVYCMIHTSNANVARKQTHSQRRFCFHVRFLRGAHKRKYDIFIKATCHALHSVNTLFIVSRGSVGPPTNPTQGMKALFHCEKCCHIHDPVPSRGSDLAKGEVRVPY